MSTKKNLFFFHLKKTPKICFSFRLKFDFPQYPDVNSTSTVYRVLYQALDGENRVTNSSLILKHASDDKNDRVHLNIRKIFLREIYIYDEVRALNRKHKQNSKLSSKLNPPNM